MMDDDLLSLWNRCIIDIFYIDSATIGVHITPKKVAANLNFFTYLLYINVLTSLVIKR